MKNAPCDADWALVTNPKNLAGHLASFPKSDFADVFAECSFRSSVTVSNGKVTNGSHRHHRGIGIRHIDRHGIVHYRFHPLAPNSNEEPEDNKEGLGADVQVLRRENGAALNRWQLIQNLTLSVDRVSRWTAIADREGAIRQSNDEQIEIIAEVRYAGGSHGRATERTTKIDDATIRSVVDEAVRDAEACLEAVSIDPGEFEVILAPGRTGMFIHELVGHSSEADLSRQGTEDFWMPECLTVVDRGPGGQTVCDDEGKLHHPVMLIDRGRPAGQLSDRMSAKAGGGESSGNGRRQDYRFLPLPRMWETYIAAGTEEPEDMVKSIKHGVFVNAIEDGHTYADANGMALKITRGQLIEHGVLTRPIAPIWICGSRQTLARAVTAIGKDLQFSSSATYCGKSGQWIPVWVGQPTIRLSRVPIGYF